MHRQATSTSQKQLEEDEATCAMSLDIMQHPVRATFENGTHKTYELCKLYEWVAIHGKKTDPLTRFAIKNVDYDLALKVRIDKHPEFGVHDHDQANYGPGSPAVAAMLLKIREAIKPVPALSIWGFLSSFGIFSDCFGRSEESVSPINHERPMP